MNREQRIGKWAVIAVNARKKDNGLFGTYNAMDWLGYGHSSYHLSRSYGYSNTLIILNEMVQAGLLLVYRTSQNENVYRLSGYEQENPKLAVFRRAHRLPRFVTRAHVTAMAIQLYGNNDGFEMWISCNWGEDYPCELEIQFYDSSGEQVILRYSWNHWIDVMMAMSGEGRWWGQFDDIPF